MTKFFRCCFDKWWRPLIFFGLTAIVFGLSEIIPSHTLNDYSFYLFTVGLLGLLISIIYQLKKKKWLFAFLTLMTFGLGVFGFFLLAIAQFFTYQMLPDHYADNLVIPTNITIYEPVDDAWSNRRDSTLQVDRKKFDFELYKSFQPGLYEYDLWMGKIDSGNVFLKVYEITQNDRLSKERLTESSSIRVGNLTDDVKRYSTKDHFTIYEGDFGKPYAARFEVWYFSDKGKERKLIEKNYKIEGWQH